MARLHLHQITKHFPGVTALDGVDLTVEPGEIHALCGENGAGKSTLMHILSGNLAPTSGSIFIDDRPVTLRHADEASREGIAIVHQHLSLIPSLSVADNVYANRQPVNNFGFIQNDKLFRQTAEWLQRLGLTDLHPGTPVANLSPAEKQMVEIAKALSLEPSILILDEPTAAVTQKEVTTLFAILRQLVAQGKVAVIYISHRLDEILQLADRVTVLKDGRVQGTFGKHELSRDILINKMIGRDLLPAAHQSVDHPDVALEAKRLTGKKFREISFQLHRGEILGFAGLAGAGRTEIMRGLMGIDPIFSGEIFLHGKRFKPRHPSDSIAHGIALVPEERKTWGLFPDRSIRDNVMATFHSSQAVYYDEDQAEQEAQIAKTRLGIVCSSTKQHVGTLSGGNQQKVVLAKWLRLPLDILIVDEPTHGIDVGAKYDIYRILEGLTKEGRSILLVSSEIPELIALSNRVIVINNGRISGTLERAELSEENIMNLAAN